MRHSARQRPTNLELEILKALWRRGPSTVREVREELARSRRVGYTTVLKMLQVMTEKGLVKRDERQRAHVYRPSESRRAVVRRVVGDVLERAFDGSTSQLLLHALEYKKATPEELTEIRRLLNQLQRRRK